MSYDFIATGRPRQVTLGLVATTYVHCDSRADDLLFRRRGAFGSSAISKSTRESSQCLRSPSKAAWKTRSGTLTSDIYDIGDRIKSMLYANALMTRFIEWPVPPPLRAIVEACMCTRPEERPTRADLRAMIGQMQL
ncbi:hypothetical protein F4824DRAFT_494510 [Ustulina deusta]|nr:hypothetical protein F4824DRAFT_494510 [Ustulina deusta]